jgi:hypothetical protein
MDYKIPLSADLSVSILDNAKKLALGQYTSGASNQDNLARDQAALQTRQAQGGLTQSLQSTPTITPTGVNANLQSLFNNIQKPDTSLPQGLPDYSKMSPSYVQWAQPQYHADGTATPSKNVQMIDDPRQFAYINYLAGKGTGAYVPTLQMQQLLDDRQQDYINNLANATQLNQNQDQWQRTFDNNNSQWQKTFDYNSGQDAVKNNQWQQTHDLDKQNNANNLAVQWAQLSGVMPNGTDTLAGRTSNADIAHTMLGDTMAMDKTYSDYPTSSGSGTAKTNTASTGGSAIDDFAKKIQAQQQIDSLGQQMGQVPDYQKRELLAQITAIRKGAGLE